MISGIGSIGSMYSCMSQKPDSDSMFKKIDSNQDGTIDKSEFEAMSKELSKNTSRSQSSNKSNNDSESSQYSYGIQQYHNNLNLTTQKSLSLLSYQV